MNRLVNQQKLVAFIAVALLLTACSDESNQVLSLPSEAHTNESLIAQTADADVRFEQQAVSGTRSAQIFDTETELLELEASGALNHVSNHLLNAKPILETYMFTPRTRLMVMPSAH